ncbi:MAG TPA: helix-turn-helix domain-containing protein [Lactobacillaceae bacterium]|jgi:AcrR family transcriptional regulator
MTKLTSREKLEQAAIELFRTQGYDNTTVQQIAARAGVTERTFFRQFNDKSDVMFSGNDLLATIIQTSIAQNQSDNVVEIIWTAYLTIAQTVFADLYAHAKERNAIIQSHPHLQERELLKQSHLADVAVSALAQRFDPIVTTLAAHNIANVFHVAFGLWVASDGHESLADMMLKTRKAWADLT